MDLNIYLCKVLTIIGIIEAALGGMRTSMGSLDPWIKKWSLCILTTEMQVGEGLIFAGSSGLDF